MQEYWKSVKTESAGQFVTWYIPNFDSTVLRTGGDNIVVEWTPFDIENCPLVTRDAGKISIDTSDLKTKREWPAWEKKTREWKKLRTYYLAQMYSTLPIGTNLIQIIQLLNNWQDFQILNYQILPLLEFISKIINFTAVINFGAR